MKIHELLLNEWKIVFSSNLKWSLSIFIRAIFIIGLLSIVGRSTGLIKTNDNSIKSQITIKQGNIINISKPSIVDYKPDIKDITEVITLLQKHKEELQKEKGNAKKTN